MNNAHFALGSSSSVDRDTLLDIFRRMTLVHKTDARFRALLTAGTIKMAYYPVRGQEVLSAALMTALRPEDYLVTTYRGVHDHLAKGIPPRELWAEFLGRATGTCKGKGGPMHITHPPSGVMVTTGIVGSGLPIANGLALASQLRKEGRVTVVCFGDGASNIGAFHEALNLASVWNLPVVYVCQNNQYAEHTAYASGTSADRVVTRAVSYAMNGVSVDGNDAEAMYLAAKAAVERARSGHGPTLIEAQTFRLLGHIFGAGYGYVPQEQMAAAVAADPVPAFRRRMRELGASEAELTGIEKEIAAVVLDAEAFAMASPRPDIAEIHRDVFKPEQIS